MNTMIDDKIELDSAGADVVGAANRSLQRDWLQKDRTGQEQHTSPSIHLLHAPRRGEGRAGRLPQMRHETSREKLTPENDCAVRMMAKKRNTWPRTSFAE